VKPIELLVRSQVWDAETKRAFFAHLEKRMKDDARIDYCRRKADFLARDARKTRAALVLIEWALATFTKASSTPRAHALATRSELLRALGQRGKAAAAWRAARRLDRTFA
jgi:hypothetical protein